MDNPEIILRCMNGFTLYVKGQNIIVSTKRVEETFPISKIQSFSLKEPKGLSAGTIVFSTAKAATTGVNLGFGIAAAIGSEKNFFYQKSELENALKIRDYISNYEPHEHAQPSTGKIVSVVDEIRGLKSLLDEGILTQEEFDFRKRELLGMI